MYIYGVYNKTFSLIEASVLEGKGKAREIYSNGTEW